MKCAAVIFASVCFVFLSSCSTPSAVRPQLPADVLLDDGAGHGDFVLLPLRMENRRELLFIVDTGAPFSLFDQSLEPALGKRLGRRRIKSMYGTARQNLYKAPRLYLGDTRLQTGDKIATFDLAKVSTDLKHVAHFNHRIMGILGMDCLRNYSVQLDIANRKMHFLDTEHLGNPAALGAAFPIVDSFWDRHLYIRDSSPDGRKYDWLIDTGCNFNGIMPRKYARQQPEAFSYPSNRKYCLADAVCGIHYKHLYFQDGKNNMLGLGFFAWNVVTFDFPKGVMYLEPTGADPIPGTQTTNAFTARPEKAL
jgi:hypothetical protein